MRDARGLPPAVAITIGLTRAIALLVLWNKLSPTSPGGWIPPREPDQCHERVERTDFPRLNVSKQIASIQQP